MQGNEQGNKQGSKRSLVRNYQELNQEGTKYAEAETRKALIQQYPDGVVKTVGRREVSVDRLLKLLCD